MIWMARPQCCTTVVTDIFDFVGTGGRILSQKFKSAQRASQLHMLNRFSIYLSAYSETNGFIFVFFRVECAFHVVGSHSRDERAVLYSKSFITIAKRSSSFGKSRWDLIQGVATISINTYRGLLD